MLVRRLQHGGQTHLAERCSQQRLHHPPDERDELLLVQPQAFHDGCPVLTVDVRRDVGPCTVVAQRGFDEPTEEQVRLRVESADDAPIDHTDASIS